MLRPSPTSISLSATDISFHLEHIGIYHGLLKQGFKRKDIRRFFTEQKAANAKRDGAPEPENSLRAPSYVELASGGNKSAPARTLSATLIPIERSLPTASINSLETETVEGSEAIDHLESRLQSSTPDCPQRIATSASNQAYHAPRKSSLLRFSSNMSSDEHERLQVQLAPRSQIRYRPRTETYSFEQSEVEGGSSSSSIVTVFEELTLDQSPLPPKLTESKISRLRGNAEEFTPHHLVTPGAVRNDHGLNSLPASAPRIIPKLVPESAAHSLQLDGVIPSSPPLPIRSSGVVRNLYIESPTLPPMPSTPQFLHRVLNSRTEPRDARFRYLDGPSFTPYNDSLPSSFQPQTPADLARQPLIGEFNAAYTAPPGRLRNDLASLERDSSVDLDSGPASPTNRAIQMRQRRNREYARSARIEGLRISRLRGRYPVRSGDQTRIEAWFTEEHLNLWRDDLDADRVGAENFEDADNSTETTGNGIRIVSGNLRANDP